MASAGEAKAPESPTLGEYAAIRAALSDDVPLDEALAARKLRPKAFQRADRAWKRCLADDPELFERYRRELAHAEDARSRAVRPIDDDPAAWVAFLHAISVDKAVAARAGLRTSDLSRLARRWSRRLTSDPELGERLAELGESPGPLPAIVLEERAARDTSSEPTEASKEAQPAAEGDSGMGLDGYAALSAELSLFPDEADRIWQKHGVRERAARPLVQAAWTAAIAADIDTERAFRQLAAHYRGQFSRRGKAHVGEAVLPAAVEAPVLLRPPSGAALKLRATALLHDVAKGPALPFSEASERSAAPRPGPQAPKVSTGTALSLEGQVSRAMPFVTTEGEPSKEHAAAPKLQSTALAIEPPREFSLPFAPSSEVSRPPKAPPRPAPNPAEKLARTAPLPDGPRPSTPPLPFPGSEPDLTRVERPSKKAARFAETSLGFVIPKNLPPARQVDHAGTIATPATPPPLRLEQHASLHVELAMGRDRMETLSRYGVSEEQLTSLDEHYKKAREQDPQAGATWDGAYETYRAWMRGQQR